MVLGLIVELIPIGSVIGVRTANSYASKSIVKAESGKIVYWGINENGDVSSGRFEMDGTNYVGLELGGSTETWKLGKPVANIRYKSSEEGFNKFMSFLYARDDTSTLYPIINEKGFKLYTIGSDIFCPENQIELVTAYYKDISNFDTRNSIAHVDFKYKNVILKQGVFKKLYQLCLISDNLKLETIKIPKKYSNIQNPRKTGTSAVGYHDGELYAYSKDGVVSIQVSLGLINGQIYLINSYTHGGNDGNHYITGCRLLHEINGYLVNTIF